VVAKGEHRRGQWSDDDAVGVGRHKQTEEEKKEGAAALGVSGVWGWVDVDGWQPYIVRV
jgi:hypothetical protein